MTKKLSVAFLWHMHQPLYKDRKTGKAYLPWVRLHSAYSYLDMIAVLKDFPSVRVTFNITPSLIQQLVDFSPENDVFLEISRKDAESLTIEDKCFILKNFFSCDPESAIFPIERYGELFHRRGSNLAASVLRKKIKEFSEADFRDLQVFFNLAWCGFTLREREPVVKELLRKGAGYTEDEKLALLILQEKVVASIIPAYKKMQDEGRIEITTSPFYHPILPLLCRGSESERLDFHEDADAQIKKGIELYEKVFGKKPSGMWPSEGAVSEEVIPLLVDNGIEWIATDEGILRESFKRKGAQREDLLYKAYKAGSDGKEIDILFRDINLSNAISFKYAHMTGKDGAEDFLGDIAGIRKATESAESDPVVAVILDGENPWPYYRDGGKEFIAEVYKHLSSAEEVRTVTVRGYLKECAEREKIEKLSPGSWINANFDKWIGSPQKNRAWEYLRQTREALFSTGEISAEALEELYIAESSDWFWWYDEFGSELNLKFDELFRMHLVNIYRMIGKEPPENLSRPIPLEPSEQELESAVGPSAMGTYPKVLIIASEIFPFAKTGGLADMVGSLSKSLVSLGCEVRMIMPFYSMIKQGGFKIKKETRRIKHPLLKGMGAFDLYSHRHGGVTTYFVDKKRYFAREGLYGTSRGDYPDNGSRFSFFSAAAVAAIEEIGFKPDIIHCNDWETALVPFYLKFKLADNRFYKDIKTLFTIHNLAYQGMFGRKIMRKAHIPDEFFNSENLEYYGKINFMKAGILYSDAVNTVSRSYAREMMTPELGFGLDGLLRSRKEALYGIINGVDYSVWSPENDNIIKVNFGTDNIERKNECKKDLLEYTGLKLSLDAPLLGSVTRLVEQKGMDLAANIMDRIVQLGAGFVLLGRGDRDQMNLFKGLAKKYPDNVYFCTEFNDELAHKIEAGCDIFLMPSRYEPCGLNQMYSIKYGTIPVVRATGGLDDVIVDVDDDCTRGNGFKFGSADEEDLYEAIERAVTCYKDKGLWGKLMVRAMGCDFSWDRSAKQYVRLYRKLMK